MKRISIFKRLLILVLVFIMSINSFAAIVADNDGATFITKAEFDSLKNNFQAQIDNYNTSIDSKIEGAIASYLAGIKVATTQMINTIEDYSGGARSIVADDWTLGTDSSYVAGGMPWIENKIGLDFSTQITDVLDSSLKLNEANKPQEIASYIIKYKQTPQIFKERMVKNYNASSGQVSWVGYCETKQNIEGTSFSVGTTDKAYHLNVAWTDYTLGGPNGSGTYDDPYILYAGAFFFPDDSTTSPFLAEPVRFVESNREKLTNKNVDIIRHWLMGYNCGSSAKSAWENQSNQRSSNSYDPSQKRIINVNAQGLSITRDILSTKEKYIILCNNDTSYKVHRLSDMDCISGFRTDQDIAFKTGHTCPSSSISSWFTSIKLDYIGIPVSYGTVNNSPSYWAEGQKIKGYWKESDTDQVWFAPNCLFRMNYRTGTTFEYPRTQRGYFGFMSEVDDWRKISDGNYGSLVNVADIKSYQKEGASTTFLNHDGTELMIGAGLPVIKLERDKEYKFKMKIDTGLAPNETGDYYIWFKDGSFTDGKKPQNESNLYTVTGISKDSTGYIMPKNVEKEIIIKATQNGYLFCKWRCKTLNGGGILYIDKDVACTSE